MTFGKTLLIGWLIGLVFLALAIFRSKDNSKAGALGDLLLVILFVMLPLSFATFIWAFQLYRPAKDLNAWKAPSIGTLYETHSFPGRPSVAIYMQGFPDASFSAYLVDDGPPQPLFLTLPEMLSQFGYATNSITRDNQAKRVCAKRNGVGMYEVFWSRDLQRFAIAFKGHFIAAYDYKTGQKIQIREGIDNKSQSQALGAVIERFLDGAVITDTEASDVRRRSYSGPMKTVESEVPRGNGQTDK